MEGKKSSKKPLPERWQKERRAARAVQVAFDLGERVQSIIRREAVDRGVNASDRVREILGLPVISRPKRLRLSISLADEDFATLARQFGVDAEDRVAIKQIAAEKLVEHAEQRDGGTVAEPKHRGKKPSSTKSSEKKQ